MESTELTNERRTTRRRLCGSMLSNRRFGSFRIHHPDEGRQRGRINYANNHTDYYDSWENQRRVLRDRGRY